MVMTWPAIAFLSFQNSVSLHEKREVDLSQLFSDLLAVASINYTGVIRSQACSEK